MDRFLNPVFKYFFVTLIGIAIGYGWAWMAMNNHITESATPCPPCQEIKFQKVFFDHNSRTAGWDYWQCVVTPLNELGR